MYVSSEAKYVLSLAKSERTEQQIAKVFTFIQTFISFMSRMQQRKNSELKSFFIVVFPMPYTQRKF